MKILPKKWRKLGIDLKKLGKRGQNIGKCQKILSRTFRKLPKWGTISEVFWAVFLEEPLSKKCQKSPVFQGFW
jgi:hypothetical protein